MKAANFIAGEWRDSVGGRTYEKRNPFQPADVVGEFPASEASDVDAAVEAASDARGAWSALPPQHRGAILFRAAERSARVRGDRG